MKRSKKKQIEVLINKYEQIIKLSKSKAERIALSIVVMDLFNVLKD